jgi:hypothetical protein
MRRIPLWLLSVSVLLLLVGCSTTLKLNHAKRPAYLSELRAEYLAENPNGPYSERVYHGEVVKGMDLYGVLASWGYPERRTHDSAIQETWTYVDGDELSGDSVEYVLGFREGVLHEWYSTMLSTGMVPVSQLPTPPPLTAEPTGKSVPLN